MSEIPNKKQKTENKYSTTPHYLIKIKHDMEKVIYELDEINHDVKKVIDELDDEIRKTCVHNWEINRSVHDEHTVCTCTICGLHQ
jgi:hypothetical protein